MARELNASDTQPLASQVTIPTHQAAALHRLINRQDPEHRATYRAALGLDHPTDQQSDAS